VDVNVVERQACLQMYLSREEADDTDERQTPCQDVIDPLEFLDEVSAFIQVDRLQTKGGENGCDFGGRKRCGAG